MSDFAVYRGKCSPEQLRDILLMAMTVKKEEIEKHLLRAKDAFQKDHIYFPANWCRWFSSNKNLFFHCYDQLKGFERLGIRLSPASATVGVPGKVKNLCGISFWTIREIRKRSKSGNLFEATQNIEILEKPEDTGGSPLKVSFDIRIRETVLVTEWGFKLHSHWLDFCRTCGVKLEQIAE